MTFISYAQNFEDVMLARALREVEHGFYIDVGAQDPVNDSVTKAFYLRGWRGINIEPVTHWYELLQTDRPDDVNVQLAVSDGPGNLRLFEVVDTGLSTTDSTFARRHAEKGREIRESNVPCVTLDALCDKYRVDCVHFLKIDCEGAEAAAVRGMSLQRVRPWIILIEATEPNSQVPAFEEWEPLLTGRGYHFVYQDGLNRFYVADEKRELDRAFIYPPNVFDNYMRAPEALAREELGVLQGEAVALRHNVEHLQSENQRREEALVEQRHALGAALEREARDREEFGRLHERILLQHREIARLHTEIHLRNAEIARLQDWIQAIHRSTSWRITGPLRWVRRAAGPLVKLGRRTAYLVLRWPARGVRPMLRWLARSPRVRAAAARVVSRESTLGRHASLFLFGAPPVPAPETEASGGHGVALTHHAMQVLDEIQEARAAHDVHEGSGESA